MTSSDDSARKKREETAADELAKKRARHWQGRSRVIQVKRLPLLEIQRLKDLYPDLPGVERPKTRADCEDSERPCPFVACRHHLAIDVSTTTGSIKVNQPGLELEEMEETCSLDVADQGGKTLEEVGEIMNLTRERVRQLETNALRKLKKLEMALPRPKDFEGRIKNRTED